MSEEEKRITKVEKEKDPRRVVSGKRLGAISKAAKMNKAYERQRAECTSEEQTESTCYGGYSTITVITGVGVLAGLVCLYFTYRQDKRAQAAAEPQTTTQPPTITQPTDSKPSRSTPRDRLLTLDS